jgi:glucokinase
MSEDGRILVGDVGGTHARFAVVDTAKRPWTISARLELDTGGCFADALRTYLSRAGLSPLPSAAAMAVAGPVTAGAVRFTNRDWTITEDELRAFGFSHALLINDFAALAFAVAELPPAELRTIGPDIAGLPDAPISIIGAGTGFGAACLARFHGRAVPLATEGGHMGFAPGTAREAAVLGVLLTQFAHVSIERVLSGPGLENLYGALAALDGRKVPALDAAGIVAHRESDPTAGEAVDMFCAVYGSVAGDFALAHGARGGVYIAGGIAQKIETVLKASAFRVRFEAKGRLSPYVKSIPTRLVLGEDAAFFGTAAASLSFRRAA